MPDPTSYVAFVRQAGRTFKTSYVIPYRKTGKRRKDPASRGNLDLCTAVLESMVYRLSAEMKGICGNGEKGKLVCRTRAASHSWKLGY